MILLRAFIAIEIPQPVKDSLKRTSATLREKIGNSIRWVPVDNMHLTLKFLSDILLPVVDALPPLLQTEAGLIPPFEIHVGGLGSFPNWKMPRVLWVGIQAPAELEALFRGIESACGRLGIEPETRGFSPHLTIGRVKPYSSTAERSNIRRVLESTTIDSLGVARVDSVHLFKSDLKPSGAVYTRLFSVELRASAVE